jgi:hypothetical protein
VEISKKREVEITKLRKDLDTANSQIEISESSMRKRYQTTINEMSEQIETLQRQKNKYVIQVYKCCKSGWFEIICYIALLS